MFPKPPSPLPPLVCLILLLDCPPPVPSSRRLCSSSSVTPTSSLPLHISPSALCTRWKLYSSAELRFHDWEKKLRAWRWPEHVVLSSTELEHVHPTFCSFLLILINISASEASRWFRSLLLTREASSPHVLIFLLPFPTDLQHNERSWGRVFQLSGKLYAIFHSEDAS